MVLLVKGINGRQRHNLDKIYLMKKIVYITGDSHTAGAELTDYKIFSDYQGHLDNYKNADDKSFVKMQDEILKHRLKFLLDKFQSKRFRKMLLEDPKKAGSIASRYFQNWEKKLSWTTELQKILPTHDIINESAGGRSFKYNLRQTLNFLDKNKNKDVQLIMIHQVPHFHRTYIKLQNKIYDHGEIFHIICKKELNIKITAEEHTISERYKSLVLRDVKHDYFMKVFKKYILLLRRHSDVRVKNYFILENDKLNNFFDEKEIIIGNFAKFRTQFINGHAHAIDKNFPKDIAVLVKQSLGL